MNFQIGTIIAVISLILVIAGHLCATVWWMAKITTTLEHLTKSFNDLLSRERDFANKTEVAKDMGRLEKSVEAIWRKLDEPHICPNNKG